MVTREVHWVLASLGRCPREVRGQRLCVAAWGLDLSASVTIDRGAHAHTPLTYIIFLYIIYYNRFLFRVLN